jgi:glycosyltransferase A (GT-A) superfamily protein (DUF2064 family)
MAAFFAAAFRSGERVVLIGSDSPDLPAEFIAEAFSSLATHDVVLGPSADGGYYLVGAARRVPPIFEGIAWSTPDVWPQTVALLSGCRWCQLPRWYDVDTGEDLHKLMARLAESSPADPHLAALARRLFDLLREPPRVI